MSRSLPSRPNLEHLRKQAKDLLDQTRAQHPSWQLADAQFALARGYGFSSWPALKSHVDSVAADAAAIGSIPVPSGAAGMPDDAPLSGSWRANLAASTRHPAFPFLSATLDVRVSGARVTMTQVVVDPTEQPSGSTLTIEADGVPHPVDGGGTAHRLIAQWLDARTLEVVDTLDGHEVGRGRYEVSADARRLTVTTAEQRIVFDRHVALERRAGL